MDEFSWRIARSVYPILASIAVLGICLNTILFMTTIVTKSLRSTANILIGCCAMFDIMHEFGYFIQFPILFSDYYIDSMYCSCMQFIPALGRAAGAFCVLSIGLDRMLCITMSNTYERTKKLHLLMFHLLTITIFCCWTVFLMVAYWTHKQQICSMPAPFHGDSLGLWSNTITVVNILSALLYFITWKTVKRRKVSEYTKTVFSSIALVMVVEVTGCLISSIFIDLSKIYVVPERQPPFHYVACLFVNSGIALKCVLYYSICRNYRRGVRSMLGWRGTRVVPGSVIRAMSPTTNNLQNDQNSSAIK